MDRTDISMSLTPPSRMNLFERIGSLVIGLGVLALLISFLSAQKISVNLVLAFSGSFLAGAGILATINFQKHKPLVILSALVGLVGLVFMGTNLDLSGWAIFSAIFGLISVGGVVYFWGAFGKGPAGIKNNGIFHSSATRQAGLLSWVLAIVFTGFYIVLYWFPEQLSGLILAADPLYHALTGKSSYAYDDGGNLQLNQWFVYGLIYTLAVLVMGFRFILKYRHNRYQVIRTLSVSFFQLVFAFALPHILEALNYSQKMAGKAETVTSHYFTYFWPLDYDIIEPGMVTYYTGGENPYYNYEAAGFGDFGWFVIIAALVVSFIGVPVLTYFYGKRWYCSWVCGCGGLAETAGDPFRQQSDKSLKAWRFERVIIHSVLVLVTLMTGLLLLNWQFDFMDWKIAANIKSAYGFVIASTFAGVVGTGFYPILGSRVWCRFGCPQAAFLGILQKYFSRFRITTNGSQCISCGNCSTYCEMGIDVKAYAQRGQNIVRASCVGCGVCSAVCPRGVLNLENGPTKGRINDLNPISISADEVKVSP